MTSSNGPVTVTFRGSLESALTLVECLEDKGAEVIWAPPEEPRTKSGVPHEIIIDLMVYASEDTAESASLAVARAGRDEFRKRVPDAGSVEVHDAHE